MIYQLDVLVSWVTSRSELVGIVYSSCIQKRQSDSGIP